MSSRRFAVCALLAAVVLPGCAGGGDPPPRGKVSITTTSIVGQQAAVFAPARANGTLVVVAHGAGQSAAGALEPGFRRELYNGLAGRGYTVVVSDAHGDNWGSFESVADLVAVRQAFVRLPRVVLLAESMGGLDAMSLVGLLNPAAIAMQYPVCDLRTLGPANTAKAEAALGAEEPERAPQLSPVTVVKTSANVRIWASPADTVVPKAQNADVCAQELRAAGADVTETETSGEHGNYTNFDLDGMAQLFGRGV